MSGGTSGSASEYLTALFRAGTLSNKSDSELLEQFISARSEHDENAELAFSVLLQRHGAMVLRVCRGVLGNEHRPRMRFKRRSWFWRVEPGRYAGRCRLRRGCMAWRCGSRERSDHVPHGENDTSGGVP